MRYFGSIKQERISKDIIWLFTWFILSIIVVYFLPRTFTFLWLFLLIILSQNEKNKLKWLVFVIFISESPGGFFSSLDPNNSLEFYFFRNVIFFELYTIISILKHIIQKKYSSKTFYTLTVFLLLLYFVFMFSYSLLFGMSLVKILRVIRFAFPLLWLYVLPAYFNNFQDIKKFIILINFGLYFMIFSQLFAIISQSEIVNLFGGINIIDANLSGINRVVYGSLMLTTAIIGNLILFNVEKRYKRVYLLNTFLFLFSIFLSATRGYIIASTFIVFFALVITQKVRTLKYFAVFIIIAPILISINTNIQQQIEFVNERLSTLEGIVTKDVSQEETIPRLTERSPRVMSKFKESPIIGFGFRQEFFIFSDGHVGNQNLLLNSGVIGTSIFLILLLNYLIVLQLKKNKKSIASKFINVFTVLQIGILGYFILHSTSVQIFSFIPGPGFIKISILFAWANFFILNSKTSVVFKNRDLLNNGNNLKPGYVKKYD